MSVFSDNKNENFSVKLLNDVEKINSTLKESKLTFKKYEFYLEIYMINKNEEFSKIKNLSDIKEYAVIKDENGKRSVVLNSKQSYEAKIYSIFLIRDVLYNFGFYELMYINQDKYLYETKINDKIINFEIIDVKNQGCFLKCDNVSLDIFKNIIFILEENGIKIDRKNLKIDYFQNELNKVLYKRKK